MNRQSLFIRQCVAASAAILFALSFALTGVASAAPRLDMPGRPKHAATVQTPTLPAETLAPAAATTVESELVAFAASVVDGRAGVLRGVYVPGVLALRVVQQAGAFSVDMTPGLATQFSAASAYGVTGLPADDVPA